MSTKLIESVISSVEYDVCVRLSVAGYGSLSSLLSSVSGVESSVVREEVVEVVRDVGSDVVCALRSVGEKVGEKVGKSCIVLPWCGKINDELCLCLRKDLGLYTQCKKSRSSNTSSYCVNCQKLIDRHGGESPYGTVSDRQKCGIMEYKDPQGKSPISFNTIMKKLNQSREEVELEGKRLGLCIPECHFEEKKEKRGRPKKDTSTEDTESDKSDVDQIQTVEPQEKKKRGRPKKEKEIISNNAGEDLIASLVQDVPVTPQEEEELEEEEEETFVVKFEIHGTTYLKSDDHVLYDMNSHEGIGIWNEETQEIENLPDDDED